MSITEKEQDEKPSGTRRPIIPVEFDVRVAQYSEKNGLTKREAYAEIIDFVIDCEGNVKKENIQT